MLRAGFLLLAFCTFTAACSSADDSDSLSGARSSAHGKSSDSAKQQPSGSTDAPEQQAATAKPAVPQAQGAPLAANVCENPTCDQTSCRAKDGDGNDVSIECQGGLCTCTTGDQITTQVGATSDPRSLFFSSCECL